MDGNKDEADRCISIALHSLKQGNVERAEKFARKADNLFPSDQAKQLLSSLAAARDQSNHSSNADSRSRADADSTAAGGGARRRAPSATRASKPNSDSSTTEQARDYTAAQLEMVNRIKRCKDYYEVLTVSKTCTDSDVKKAYKKLALQLHPDKNRAPGAVEAFKSVGNAVAVLTDAQKRKAYDLYGAEGAAQQHSSYGRPGDAQHHHHYQQNNEYSFSRGFESEFTADELFNMFFGTGFPQQRMNQRNQRQYAANHQEARQPSLAFGLILVLIVISMLSSLFTSDPVYSLSASTRYPVRRHTAHLNVQYFVKEKFESEYQGSLARLENSVEEEYIAVMTQNCYRERSYREMMISRARSYGSQTYFKQAQELKVPSCENLSRIGITKYMPY